jgi:signal peptidase I
VGGDTIEIRNKKTFVNGKEVVAPYAHYFSNSILPGDATPRDNLGPISVPENRLFVMGDNRDFSHDSRWWGFVPVEDVKGEAFLIYYSAQDFPSVRLGRLFNIIR